ncbi:MAG: transglycosylase domain-containing protein, partial [Pseudoflavonifractor sp.]
MANTNEMHGGTTPPKKRRKKRRSRGMDILATIGKVLGTTVLIGITTGAILACFAAVYIQKVIVPQADLNLVDFSMDLSTTMYYADKETGNLQELRTIYGSENRVWVSYQDLPKNLIDATISIEDHRFPKHHGVDWIRTVKGVITMFTGGDIQGGSTITQQLIKNLTTEDEVTVQRKILEIFRALEFEKKYSKDQIMEWYLNYIYLGEHCNGVSTASYVYFGKDVSQLSLAECASLISITNNPSIFNPYLSGKDENGEIDPNWGKKNNTDRALKVIGRMLELDKIDRAEYDEAKAQLQAGLDFVRGEGEKREETIYTWYEDKVISDVIADLEAQDISEKVATNMVYYGGLQIETCLDPAVQAIVDEVYENMENLPYTSGSGQQLQSSIVIVDPQGNVVALSGGMGEKSASRIFSRATTKRAPGSAFKPLSVYAPAIEMGLITPASVYDDSPYQILAGKPYPANSYLYYKGRMTVQDAVQISSNCVAIKALADLTPRASFDFLNDKLGFQLVEARQVGEQVKTDIALAPLSMGGLTDGVSAMEMAGAYSVFPRGGSYLKPRTYTRVLDAEGHVLLDNTTSRVPVPAVKDTTAYYINSMLKSVVNAKPGTGTEAQFSGMTIAGKTGSTNQNKDRWFVGYTPYYTAAVWTGYDQQERIKANGNPSAQLWNKVMSKVHEGLEKKDFAQPDGLAGVAVCRDSGMLASESCQLDPRGSRVYTAYYFPGDAPTTYCTVHNDSETSLVSVCTDAPILDAEAKPTGLYHLATEYCPPEKVQMFCYMDLPRERVSGGYGIRDDMYTMAYYKTLGETAVCTVHTKPELPALPAPFDPFDETTWPKDDPNFNIVDPSTWPKEPPPPPPETAPPTPPPPGAPPP